MAGVRILTVGIWVSALLAPAVRADPIMQSPSANAFVNLGTGPYPEESAITTGGARPWYDSSQVVRLFGGQPNAQQQADFDNAVIQRVEQTFQLSGISLTLTDDPSVSAAHTLSVVSQTSSRTLSSAIGMTEVGDSGFSFIDQIAPSAQSVDQLKWIVAHNVSHELMLAFGVGEDYDHTGNFIDAPMANFSMMTDPNATFSPAAARALLAKGVGGPTALLTLLASGSPASLPSLAFPPDWRQWNSWSDVTQHELLAGPALAQVENPQPVPEPATLIIWALAAAGVAVHRRRMR